MTATTAPAPVAAVTAPAPVTTATAPAPVAAMAAPAPMGASFITTFIIPKKMWDTCSRNRWTASPRAPMRLNPYHPERFWSHLGRAQFTAKAYADALQSYSRITKPDQTHHAFMAASSAQMGNATAAAAHTKEALALAPDFTATAFLGTLHYKLESDREHARAGLLKAGLPA